MHRHISRLLNSRLGFFFFDRKAKAYWTDECSLFSQFTAKLEEEEEQAQKWLPRCPDSHLTLIGCEGSRGQGSLFTCCSFHLHFISLVASPQPPVWFPWKGGAFFECEYQIVSLSAQTYGMELKIRFNGLSRRWLSLEQNRLTTAEQSVGGRFGPVYDQTQRQSCYTAAALTKHLTMIDSTAA